mgnify:CR=1 FL=1
MFEGINWLHVLVAAAASMPVGFIWYNPKVFGSVWMREIKVTMEEAQARGGNMAVMLGMTYVFAVIAAVFMNAMVAHGREMAQFDSFKHGLYHGCEMAVFVVLPVVGMSAIYEGRGLKYVLIVTGFWAVIMGIMGGILNVWH